MELVCHACAKYFAGTLPESVPAGRPGRAFMGRALRERYTGAASARLMLGELASDLRSFWVIEVILLWAINKCKLKFIALLYLHYLIAMLMITSDTLMLRGVDCRVTDCISVIFTWKYWGTDFWRKNAFSKVETVFVVMNTAATITWMWWED